MKPWWQPVFTGKEKQYLDEVINSGFPNEGAFADKFASEIKKTLNSEFVVPVTSGTAALYLSLMAHEIGPGDEVIIPDVTFIATANAVSMTGATPVIIDVDPSGLIDPEAIVPVINRNTIAIIPVHISGRSACMNEINSIADSYGLIVIEDAAEAFGSKSTETSSNLGTISHAGCFSFSPFKIITTGQGGAISVKNQHLYEELIRLKDQGRSKRGTGGADTHESIGFNFKMSDLQGAVGLAQIDTLESRLNTMKSNYIKYRELLDGVEGVELMPFSVEKGENPQWIEARVERRDELIALLASRGYGCREFWNPLHTQAPYKSAGNDDYFGQAVDVCKHHVWLPSALNLDQEDIIGICYSIREWSRKR